MPEEKDFKELEKIIGVEFDDINILKQAMVHRSFINENRDFPLDHNERMEFLGDAVLELIITEYLYLNYPNPEGELTNWRASLVNSKMLAEIATELNFEPFLFLSRGETKDTGKARTFILANSAEAVMGAIYLDQGWEAAKKFIADNILSKFDYILEHKLYMDPKSKFQEMCQERLGTTPVYQVISETGPDHSKEFEVAAVLHGKVVSKAKGTTKQEGQMNAAKAYMKDKEWE